MTTIRVAPGKNPAKKNKKIFFRICIGEKLDWGGSLEERQLKKSQGLFTPLCDAIGRKLDHKYWSSGYKLELGPQKSESTSSPRAPISSPYTSIHGNLRTEVELLEIESRPQKSTLLHMVNPYLKN